MSWWHATGPWGAQQNCCAQLRRALLWGRRFAGEWRVRHRRAGRPPHRCLPALEPSEYCSALALEPRHALKDAQLMVKKLIARSEGIASVLPKNLETDGTEHGRPYQDTPRQGCVGCGEIHLAAN